MSLVSEQTTRFMFGITFKTVYFPWALVALTVLLGGSPVNQLCGIAAGHLYYFLEDIYPRQNGGIVSVWLSRAIYIYACILFECCCAVVHQTRVSSFFGHAHVHLRSGFVTRSFFLLFSFPSPSLPLFLSLSLSLSVMAEQHYLATPGWFEYIVPSSGGGPAQGTAPAGAYARPGAAENTGRYNVRLLLSFTTLQMCVLMYVRVFVLYLGLSSRVILITLLSS
jgi:hypothetical protein